MGNLNPKIVRLHSRDDVCVAIDNGKVTPERSTFSCITSGSEPVFAFGSQIQFVQSQYF